MAVQQHVLNWLYSVLTSEYQDVNRTYNDVAQALSQFPSLSPRTDVHTFPNGASALLLHLSGTLPAVFRGATYRYPISLWVPHAYPREAPLVYVTPTENMVVRPGQHVDPQGQVYHPYLVGWSEFWDKSTIVDFLTILRDIFAKEPPVISRQVARPAPPPAVSAAPSPPPVPPLPQELASHSRSSTTSPPAIAQPPAPPPKGSNNQQWQQQQQPQAVAAASNSTPSPPPVPPHPQDGANRQSISGMIHEARPEYAASQTPSPPPFQSQTMAAVSGAPPIPGRPRYQQSPLSQPPMAQGMQAVLSPPPQPYPPYRPDSAQPQPPTPPQTQSSAYADYAGPPQAVPYYAQSQPQPQPQAYQQQQAYQQPQALPAQWQQQQQPQQQPRPRQPPAPDIMDEPLPSSSSSPSGANGGLQPGSTAAEAPPPPPPPVPPNPEKDMLLHQLAQALAAQRQHSRAQNEASLAGLQAQRAAMVAAAGRLQQDMSALAQVSALLTANTDMLHEALAAADGVVASSRQRQPPAVDDLLVGPTVVANQLYDLVAEERALADAVFMLGRAVERGRISPTVFAKMTRSLAREWYLKKALVRKIGRGMGLAAV